MIDNSVRVVAVLTLAVCLTPSGTSAADEIHYFESGTHASDDSSAELGSYQSSCPVCPGTPCCETACSECDDAVGCGLGSCGGINICGDSHWDQILENLSLFGALDGSKQPQDFGVNANLGVRLRAGWSAPLVEASGIGYQIGTAVDWSDNAVQVFELLGEDKRRFQNHVTAGVFQRRGDWGWGFVYDFLYQSSFDKTTLGQWRARISHDLTCCTQIGSTLHLRSFDDTATFLGGNVTLRSIDQLSFYLRHRFETGVRFTIWGGIADEHGESNPVTGPAPSRDEDFVAGADIYAPLNSQFAIYGETNLIMPADTGTVDAFLGLAWFPFGNAKRAHRKQFSPLLPVAADTSFAVDLFP